MGEVEHLVLHVAHLAVAVGGIAVRLGRLGLDAHREVVVLLGVTVVHLHRLAIKAVHKVVAIFLVQRVILPTGGLVQAQVGVICQRVAVPLLFHAGVRGSLEGGGHFQQVLHVPQRFHVGDAGVEAVSVGAVEGALVDGVLLDALAVGIVVALVVSQSQVAAQVGREGASPLAGTCGCK